MRNGKKVRWFSIWALTQFFSIGFFNPVSAQDQPQNLIINPSFELTDRCPDTGNSKRLKNVNDWNSPTITTPDNYDTCGVHLECISPLDGSGYVGGFILEFIEGRLKCPLVVGQTYRFKTFVRPVMGCGFGQVLDGLGVCFVEEQISKNRRRNKEIPKELVPQITTPIGEHLADTLDWISVTGEFVATGGEKFVILGFFPNEERTSFYLKWTKKGAKWVKVKNQRITLAVYAGTAYYVYDNLSLIALDSLGNIDSSFCSEVELPDVTTVMYTPSEEGGFEVLPKIKFDPVTSMVLKGGSEDFKQLLAFYYTFPDDVLDIKIHTDSLSSWEEEKVICQKRGSELRRELEAIGIPSAKINFIYVGSKEPLHPDYREVMGYSNSRIEYRFIEKR